MEAKKQRFHINKLNSLLLFLLVFFLVQLTIPSYLKKFISGLSINLITYIIWFVSTLVFCRFTHISISTFGFTRKHISTQIFFGIAIAVILLIIFVGGFTILGYKPHDYLSQAAPSIRLLFLNLVFLSFIVGPIEEFIWRGYLLSILTDISQSSAWGVVLSSVLFGASHWMGGSLIQVLNTFLIGLVFALSKQKFKNCTMLSIIVAHSLFNAILELIRWFFC